MSNHRLFAVKSLLLNGYVIAVLATVFFLLISMPLRSEFQGHPAIQLFLIGVLLGTWYGGFRAGFLATVLSVLAIDYYLFEPLNSFQLEDKSEQLRLALFSVVGIVISL
ncbi:MAG: DUF4118 domain-containing protein, partial [Methylobacter sp.]